ncbi:hypothetical protein FZEAL_1109 [Fusarium zealandicum]|uniref:C3H1-type domain-containing protein n=1 Tax=Fusarium zealandicum TaxID=1053134 RepID=A0A8H4XPR9_9HYPO|nr:hypothetical protein FZEAL_1109 [Fusarium zealandicum]
MAPWPQFFVVRPGLEQITCAGQILAQPSSAVPLIPADMLPEWLEVVGVPRHLSPEETDGMMNLGAFHAETETYQLRFASMSEESRDDSNNNQPRQEDEPAISSSKLPSSSTLQQVSGSQADASESRPDSSALKSTPNPKPARGLSSSRHNPLNRRPTPPTSPPSPSIREALTRGKPTATPPCRHWCHFGACKWGIACRFSHTMPQTAVGLAQVNLADFPDWWLQATGVMPMPPEAIRAAESRRQTVTTARRSKKSSQQQSRIMFRRQAAGVAARSTAEIRPQRRLDEAVVMQEPGSEPERKETELEEEQLIDL